MARLAEEKAVERVAVAREVDDTERVLHLDRDVLRSREAVKTLNELVLELHEKFSSTHNHLVEQIQ